MYYELIALNPDNKSYGKMLFFGWLSGYETIFVDGEIILVINFSISDSFGFGIDWVPLI